MWKQFKRPSKVRSPRLPDGIRIYAIGDVHGRADLLAEVFSKIDSDLARRPGGRPIHVLLGDYVDRGRSSREAIELLVRRRLSHELISLKGNHESCLLDFLRVPSTLARWQQLGGLETLLSYGVGSPLEGATLRPARIAEAFANALPGIHREFLENLKLSFTCGDFFFVHAGVRPGIALSSQSEEDLMWIREDFLLCEEDFGKIIVHGHTPVNAPDVRPNRINIDTGAYATGKLTCIILERDALFALE